MTLRCDSCGAVYDHDKPYCPHDGRGARPGIASTVVVDDDRLVTAALGDLNNLLSAAFAGLSPVQSWVGRGPYQGPQGELLNMGWKFFVAIPDDAKQEARDIYERLPDNFQGFDLCEAAWRE